VKSISKYWYQPVDQVPFGLKILSQLFAGVSVLRRFSYQYFSSRVYRAPLPVIVVGNIFVGGTGKTPLVIALAELLKKQNKAAGIISRGYGGKAKQWPQKVTAQSDAELVGDEPVLIATRTACPMVVGPNRKLAIEMLLAENPQLDVIISDDGLQHYAMARDMECVVIDGDRRFGNGLLLPAGPLREKQSRLQHVDFCISNGLAQAGEFAMNLQLNQVYSLNNPAQKKSLQWFAGQKVHAIAGIGHPERFFKALQNNDIQVSPCAFPDHHHYIAENLRFEDGAAILMTEKDAVKCQQFHADNAWVVPVTAQLDKNFEKQFLVRLEQIPLVQ